MSREQKAKGTEWVVMLANGRVMGPYSTEAVLKLISQGAFSGEERIKKRSGGDWVPISKEAKFYDRLLEMLEKPAVNNSVIAEQINQDTVIGELPEEALVPPLDPHLQPSGPMRGNFDETQVVPNRSHRDLAESESLPNLPAVREERQNDIGETYQENSADPKIVTLQNLGALPRASLWRRLALPLIILAIAIGLVVSVFYESRPRSIERGHLLRPVFTKASALSSQEVSSRLKRAWGAYWNDTFESYLVAQEAVVDILNHNPNELEPRGLLCLVYRELWPFVKQDSEDLETVNLVVRSTKSLEPTVSPSAASLTGFIDLSLMGTYCEISKLIIKGNSTDAGGVLNYYLNMPRYTNDPVLILGRAENMAASGRYQEAASYADSSLKVWRGWMKAYLEKADFLLRSGQPQLAASVYEEILKANPQHKVSQLQYGILSYRHLRRPDQALNRLTGALAMPGKVLSQIEARAHFVVGQIYIDQKQPGKAISFVKRAFELNPADSEYKAMLVKLGGSADLRGRASKYADLVALGDQYFNKGDCLAAQAEYKTAFELDSANAVAAMKAAKCMWKLGHSSEALEWLGKAIAADKNLIEAYTLEADYNSQKYNYPRALQILNQAAGRFPNNAEVLRGYGNLEFRRNNYRDAIGFLKRSKQLLSEDPETLMLLARSHGAIGEYEEAQKNILKAMEIDSTNNEIIVVYAKNLVQFRGLNAGLAYIKDQISKYSDTIPFRLALAEIYRDVERYREAQTVFEQIVEYDRNNKKAYLGLGESCQALGLFDKALKAYMEAAVIDPWDAEPLIRVGLLFIDMNRYKEAIEQLRRAVKINPFYPRGHFYIGRAAFLAGDTKLAIDSCLAERKINPNVADSYVLAAEVYASQKDFVKCANEYQYAVKLRPQGAEIYVKMARCYRQSGSLDIADSMLHIAETLESGLPEIQKELGAIAEGRGDIRMAHAAYSKYLLLAPNAPDRQSIEQRIDSLQK